MTTWSLRSIGRGYAATALLSLLPAGLSVSQQAFGQGQAADELSGSAGEPDAVFEVGGSCAALAYLNNTQLKGFINAGYSDDFHSFCFPEEPSECSDYTGLLEGLGRLSAGEDGYHCSLQLQP